MMQTRDIVVIGGSAGSGKVLKQILSDVPPDLAASLFIVTHKTPNTHDILGEILGRHSRLPVAPAIDNRLIERGRVYIAPPDRHLLLLDGKIRLGDGPRENMARPSIDALFRSAALSFGPRVVGVILSGLLNDGVAGLASIKSCGGTCIVQDPAEAHASDMPAAALEAVVVDHVVKSGDLATTIAADVQQVPGQTHQPSDSLRLEVEIAAGARLGSDELRRIADPSTLSCPTCQGVLSEVRGTRPLRFRCQIGHAYTGEILAGQSGTVDEAVGLAMRIMEERVALVVRMANDARENGRDAVASLYDARAAEYRTYTRVLRDAALTMLRSRRQALE